MTDDEYRAAIFPMQPFGPIPEEGENEQWNHIHFLFSRATLWAQAYEDGMARFVVAAEKKWQRSGKTPEQITKMTLGTLQKEYVRYCHLQPHHYERLVLTLDVRNRLAHSFYRRRMHQLGSSKGRQQVIDELQRAVDLFTQERDEMYWNLGLVTGQEPM